MENRINERSSEAAKNEFYGECLAKFAKVSNYKEYIELSKDFKLLGNYKEALEDSRRCEKAAWAPAYKEATEKIQIAENMTFEGFSDAAAVMESISEYKDAREMARIYKVKAQAYAYTEAMAIFEDSESGIDKWERGVYLLSKIKSYKNSRDLYDRYYGHYAQKRYEQATEIMKRAGTHAEYMLAQELFLKISEYSDAAKMAEMCKKSAQKYKVSPRQTQKAEGANKEKSQNTEKVKTKREKSNAKGSGVENEIIKRESVWTYLNKKKLCGVIVCFVLSAIGIWGSIIFRPQNRELSEFFRVNAYKIRGVCIMVTVASIIIGGNLFVKMMTPKLKEMIRARAIELLKSIAGPVAKFLDKMLSVFGVNTGKSSGQKDEKSFIYTPESREKKQKKLKNSAKWEEQENNAERVRFIFIDYMIAKIREGFVMKHNHTPSEIKGKMENADESEFLLFDTYNKARYAGKLSLDEIDNETVELLKSAGKKK